MNNKRIFSVKLFWQSFLQLKVIGLVSSAIMVFFAAFPIIMSAISINRAVERAGEQALSDYVSVVNPVGQAGILVLTFLILTPVLALYAWNFLNKRSTSDFYHSLSYRRENLYLTRLAAVVAWQLIMFVLMFLATVICYTIYNEFFVVDYGTMFKVYASEFLCNLLCAAAISFACSLTGNIFSNICLTGLILFFPRFILMLVQQFLSSMVFLASSQHLLPFLDNDYNLLVGQVFSMFTNTSITKILLSNAGMIYTLVLSVIYIVIGCLLFMIRKSETAGKPTLNWKLQFAIRCIIGFTISVVGVLVYIQIKKDGSENSEPGIFYVIMTFIIAAVVVVVYELISSKKIHRVIKAVPSIIVSYAAAILFGIAVSAGADRMLAYSPSADNVQYIKLSSSDRIYGGSNDYFSGVIENIKIDDKDIIELITDSLKDNIKTINENEDDYWSILNSSNNVLYEVYIKDGPLGRYRNVYVSSSDIQKLAEKLTKLENFCDEYRRLPEFDNAVIRWNEDITDEKSREIYDTLLREISEISFADWYSNVNSSSGIVMMDIEFSRDGVVYNSYVPLTNKLPDTINKYLNAVNETTVENNKEGFDSMKSYISDMSSYNGDKEFYLNITDPQTGETYSLWQNEVEDEDLISALLSEFDSPESDREFDFDRPIVCVSYYDYTSNNYDYVNYYVQPDGYDTMKDYNVVTYSGEYAGGEIYY